MGAVAANNADFVILTSDNPRSEDPRAILSEIRSGIDHSLADKVQVEVDRVTAIEQAICKAKAEDVVLLAGKGHEATQTIGSEVLAHSDAECASSMLARRGAHA